MHDLPLAELAECFRHAGFVHIPQVLNRTELDVFGPAVDAAVSTRKRNDPRALGEKSPYEQSFIQCEYLWEDFPDLRGLTFHPVIGQIAAALLGAKAVRLWHDQALYKEAGGRETDAHQDHAYWPIAEYRTLTAWIPLCAVDETNGCMSYVPGSHLGSVEFIDIFGSPGAGKELARRQRVAPVFVPAEPGDVIFHDGRTVHLAGSNRSAATRRVYTAIYFGDGCTRASDQRHASVDRPGIRVGQEIDGFATPISWPLPGGAFPEPGPWPDLNDENIVRMRRMGVLPDGGATPLMMTSPTSPSA